MQKSRLPTSPACSVLLIRNCSLFCGPVNRKTSGIFTKSSGPWGKGGYACRLALYIELATDDTSGREGAAVGCVFATPTAYSS